MCPTGALLLFYAFYKKSLVGYYMEDYIQYSKRVSRMTSSDFAQIVELMMSSLSLKMLSAKVMSGMYLYG